jgi:hypothetical protein
MNRPRATLVLAGQVVVSASADGVQTAEAIGIADGRVAIVGSRAEVLEARAPRARLVEAGAAAIVPGMHDFHLHLVGMARDRRALRVESDRGFEALVAELRRAAAAWPAGAWLRGRGWSEALLAAGRLERLEEAAGERPALLYSHDSHSAWASRAARRAAGIHAETLDPHGGRIERGPDGTPTGVLRETATDLVEEVATDLIGPALDDALDEVLVELAALGVTGATDAGDTTAAAGSGEYAALGESASLLVSARAALDGRIRLTVNLPAAAIADAAALNLATGDPLPGASSLRIGWAKTYLDGALGSRTAATFRPYLGGRASDTGILRCTPEQLDALFSAARKAGIGLAMHAIGDRAVALALEAVGRAPAIRAGAPPDRIEHAQLVRPEDRQRFAELDVTASLQPLHAPSDRPLAELLWGDRLADAYPWHALAAAGTRLAFGSDAPIESPNPWVGIFAAVHRSFPDHPGPDWLPRAALAAPVALAAYTRGPGRAMGRSDEGHLGVGARADLAVLNVDLATLMAADERLAAVRSGLTLVGGSEVRIA